MKIGPHGDVISSNLSFEEGLSAHKDVFGNSSIYIGEIRKVYTNDNTAEQERGDFTLCDVMIYRATGANELIKRCKISQPAWGGGVNNFLEHTYPTPNQATFDEKKKRSETSSNQVILAFINNNKQAAVILGTIPHPSLIAKKRRPKKSDGIKLEAEFQGLNWKIDNDGAFSLIFNGSRKDDGSTITKNGPTTININKNGNINITTNNKQTFTINKDTQTVSISCGPTTFVMDGKSDKITAKSKTIETLGTESNRVFGKKVKISKSANSEPDENLVLGKVLKKFLVQLCQEVEQLQILGNLGVPCPVPLNASKIAQLRSQFLESDKILSDFAKTEK